MDWLQLKEFVSHTGDVLPFKIECDALTDGEIETFAFIISKRFYFNEIIPVPDGGLRIAKALEKYRSRDKAKLIGGYEYTQYLIVDDVMTTGLSMERARKSLRDIGVVLFCRGRCPDWVHPIFRLWD